MFKIYSALGSVELPKNFAPQGARTGSNPGELARAPYSNLIQRLDDGRPAPYPIVLKGEVTGSSKAEVYAKIAGLKAVINAATKLEESGAADAALLGGWIEHEQPTRGKRASVTAYLFPSSLIGSELPTFEPSNGAGPQGPAGPTGPLGPVGPVGPKGLDDPLTNQNGFVLRADSSSITKTAWAHLFSLLAAGSGVTLEQLANGRVRINSAGGAGGTDTALTARVAALEQQINSLDTVPPAVGLASSSTNVTTASSITLTAAPTDNIAVSKVEFFDGATLLSTRLAPPWTHTVALSSSDNGSKTYTARAFDSATPVQNSTVSNSVVITVGIPGAGAPLWTEDFADTTYNDVILLSNGTDPLWTQSGGQLQSGTGVGGTGIHIQFTLADARAVRYDYEYVGSAPATDFVAYKLRDNMNNDLDVLELFSAASGQRTVPNVQAGTYTLQIYHYHDGAATSTQAFLDTLEVL